MTFYNTLHKHLITPVGDLFTGWKTGNLLSFFEESQWWSKEKMYDFQCQQLQKLIPFAYENTAFYKQYFDNSGIDPYKILSPEDLKKLPIIRKNEVRDNLPDKISAKQALKPKSFMQTATSGSTGLQLIYYISNSAYGAINAAALRGWNWMGFSLGDKYVKISQNKRKSTLKLLQDKANRCLLLTVSYNHEGLEKTIFELNRFKPDILRSYPDPLVFLSNYIKQYHSPIPKLKAINTTGNILFDEDRKLIKETFQTEVFDSYSCEGSAQVFECPTHNCYHISDEYAISEIVNESGNEVLPGERGRLITTDLWNFATPFIRYDTQDFVIKGHNCTCGRQLSTISKIEGRNNDILVLPDGGYLIAQNFTTYFKHFPEIIQFQVIQEDESSFLFRLKVNVNFTSQTELTILNHWTTQTNASFKIETVNEIPLLSSGKRQFVFRNPQIKLAIN